MQRIALGRSPRTQAFTLSLALAASLALGAHGEAAQGRRVASRPDGPDATRAEAAPRTGEAPGAHAQRHRARGASAGRARALRGLAALEPAQRARLLEEARSVGSVVDGARRERARILAGSLGGGPRTGDDPAVREELRALRERTRSEIGSHARRVLDALTPEQRERLQKIAARHGRVLDEQRLVRRTGAKLANPMLVPWLEELSRR